VIRKDVWTRAIFIDLETIGPCPNKMEARKGPFLEVKLNGGQPTVNN
jgi:hypothetical protein